RDFMSSPNRPAAKMSVLMVASHLYQHYVPSSLKDRRGGVGSRRATALARFAGHHGEEMGGKPTAAGRACALSIGRREFGRYGAKVADDGEAP
ncbi:MAG TPA: hypothetical protein VJT73_13200, partial [Polyangiaceae bacterium]|nr:hypothetical protein [Polyangiaceae bacterium]